MNPSGLERFVGVTTLDPSHRGDGAAIYWGDSLDVMACMPGRSIDVVVTDPPYVIGAVSAGNMASKSGGWGDMMNSSRWFRDWYRECARLLKRDGAIWTFCNWRSLPVVMKAAIDADLPVASCLVWNKEWIGPGGPVGLRPSYELVCLLPMPEFTIPDRGIPDIRASQWTAVKPSGHPAEKPVPLLRWLIEISGKSGVVLDPFMGSGSTLRAARDLNLECIGIEAEQKWCDHAIGRIAQSTFDLEKAA